MHLYCRILYLTIHFCVFLFLQPQLEKKYLSYFSLEFIQDIFLLEARRGRNCDFRAAASEVSEESYKNKLV